MSAPTPSWINTILPLPRPEYAKQPESLLTDLLWHSTGSNLSSAPTGSGTYLDELAKLRQDKKKDPPTDRLIPLRARGGKSSTTETIPIAERTLVSTEIASDSKSQKLLRALLESILAPRSRGDRSLACVPIHPDSAVLQTLQGLVNKDNPPDLAKAIEVVGWLGGSSGQGQVASLFLEAFSRRTGISDGLAGLLDNIFPVVAQHTWSTLTSSAAASSQPHPAWPGVSSLPVSSASPSALANCSRTPFYWFWKKWSVLCNAANGWYDRLPTRRFVDWATCLLRTGLAFAYLWEANFFCQVHSVIMERKKSPSETSAMSSLRSSITGGSVLATIESPQLPATKKHAWSALSNLLARGYVARKAFEDHLEEIPFPASPGDDVEVIVEKWIDSLAASGSLAKFATPLQIGPQTAINAREFVRYLLQPRSSDDDSADQADFYYLARTNSRSFWFQPGPEWLIVVTSLLCGRVGGQCTLGMLLDDLAQLGIRVERWILVGMLENSGLSVDSPDADNALLIRSGF